MQEKICMQVGHISTSTRFAMRPFLPAVKEEAWLYRRDRQQTICWQVEKRFSWIGWVRLESPLTLITGNWWNNPPSDAQTLAVEVTGKELSRPVEVIWKLLSRNMLLRCFTKFHFEMHWFLKQNLISLFISCISDSQWHAA